MGLHGHYCVGCVYAYFVLCINYYSGDCCDSLDVDCY